MPRNYDKRRKSRKKTYNRRRKTTKKYVRRIARTAGETKLSKWLWTPDGVTNNLGVQTVAPVTPERAFKLDQTVNLFIPFTADPIQAGWNPLQTGTPTVPVAPRS